MTAGDWALYAALALGLSVIVGLLVGAALAWAGRGDHVTPPPRTCDGGEHDEPRDR